MSNFPAAPCLATTIKDGDPCWVLAKKLSSDLVLNLYVARVTDKASGHVVDMFMAECVFDNIHYDIMLGHKQEEVDSHPGNNFTLAQAQAAFGKDIPEQLLEMKARWAALEFIARPAITENAHAPGEAR